jgi:hypothetical protein
VTVTEGAVRSFASRNRVERRIAYRRPWLADYQESFLFTPARYSLVEATTKSGKTQGCLIWLLEKACLEGFDGWNGWWVAPVHAQARIAYRRMKRMVRKLIEAGLAKANDTEQTVTVANGAVMWFKSGEKPDNLFGEDVYVAVIDEASRLRVEAWDAVRTTLTATRGSIRIIGNVKGRKNWFYQFARIAQAEMAAGNSRYHYAKLTAWDAVKAGILEQAEIEDAQKVFIQTGREAAFKELYLAEPTDDGANPFGIAGIRKCVMDRLTEGPSRANGIDLAKSIDWTVELSLNREQRMCAFERYQRDWEYTTAHVIKFVGGVPTYIDSSGVGDPVVERVQKGRSNVTGYKFSQASKQKLMEGLAVAIAEAAAEDKQWIYKGPGDVVQNELEVFEFVYTRTGVRYEAPQGYHDDCVMALALAVEQFRNLGKAATKGGRVVTM